ncbi:MAG TPA: molybdopterin molybdotransferase MoeA, partial [Polyangiaceae bacterium]|nr:molybdopterin molybdotransferase MoeA [Polyangiaceae bacterium]
DGTAMRIFTGAAVPVGADAVIMQEQVTRDGEYITGTHPVTPGQNVRRRGEDLDASTQALERGYRLTSCALALACFLDRATVTVAKSPRVVILCTGTELREPGSTARLGSIPESNSPVVEALARQAAATVVGASIVVDDARELQNAVERALGASDVLVTIGGVSVGDYDYVRPALISAGVSLELHQVRIKPGKPITLGHRQEKIVVGLPGNPVSAAITFALFGVPLLRAMQGDNRPSPLPTPVPVVGSLKRDPNKTRVLLGNLTGSERGVEFVAHPNQSSGATVALGQCEGFVIVEPGTEPVAPGACLPFQRWTDL